MGMLEPLRTRAAHGALAAGPGHEVFPFLCRPRLEELARPWQMFGEQIRIAHDALDVSEPFLIPVGDAGGRDEFPEVLIPRAAKLHPSAVRTFEAAAPDAPRRRNDMGGIVHMHGTGADGWERGIEQGHLNALPDPVAAAREQSDDDADDALKCSIVRRDRDGGIDGLVGTRIMWSIGGGGGPDHAFEGAHLSARVV